MERGLAVPIWIICISLYLILNRQTETTSLHSIIQKASSLKDWLENENYLSSYYLRRYKSPRLFAILRHKREDEIFWQYFKIGRDHTSEQSETAFERHSLKGECERCFSEVLSGIGLHRSPCQSLGASDNLS